MVFISNDFFEVSSNLHIHFCCDRHIKIIINGRGIILDKQMWFQLSNYLPLILNASLSSESLKTVIFGSYPSVTVNANKGKIQVETENKIKENLTTNDVKSLTVISPLITHLSNQLTRQLEG